MQKQIAGRRHHRTDKRLYQFVSAHRFTIRPLLYPPSTSCGSMGILQKAERHLGTSSFLPYRLIRLAAYAEYYQLTKEYDKALVYLEDAIELVTLFHWIMP